MALACRENRGSATCTTVAGAPVRMEVYPVTSMVDFDESDPVNKLINPPAIVIYPDNQVTKNTAAILEITRYQPDSLDISDDDQRVQWTITSLGGQAKFFKGVSTGRRVLVYGSTAGEVLLEADFGWGNKASFRSLVVPLKQFKFRANRIKAGGFEPPASMDDIKKHVRMCNIFLRQVGIKLVPDDNQAVAASAGNPAIGNPGVPAVPPSAGSAGNPGLPGTDVNTSRILCPEPGYFEVELTNTAASIRMTRTAGNNADQENAIRVNARNEVINIAYVHSLNAVPATGGNQTVAAMVLNPVNHGGPRSTPPTAASVSAASSTFGPPSAHNLADSGTPSTSWVAPNGLPTGSLPTPAPPVPAGVSPARPAGLATRDGAGADPSGTPAANVVIQLLRTFWDWTATQPTFTWQPGSPVTRDRSLQWGLVVDSTVAPSVKQLAAALSHEIGHFFGLNHRIVNPPGAPKPDPYPDLVPWPKWENLMNPFNVVPDAQDLDLIQCKAMRTSEIFFRPNSASTSPEYEPSDHRNIGSLGGALLGGLIGAAVGAVVGAIVGAAIGFIATGGNPAGAVAGAKYGAIAGAAAGAVAGAIIGGLMGSNPVLP